jgi:hypothetical protein
MKCLRSKKQENSLVITTVCVCVCVCVCARARACVCVCVCVCVHMYITHTVIKVTYLCRYWFRGHADVFICRFYVLVGLFYLHSRPLLLSAGAGFGGHDDAGVRGVALPSAKRCVGLVAGARVS